MPNQEKNRHCGSCWNAPAYAIVLAERRSGRTGLVTWSYCMQCWKRQKANLFRMYPDRIVTHYVKAG